MAVRVETTPNPNAMKLTVGVPVGGPATFVAGKGDADGFAADLLGLPGVSSIFMTADFVTISKGPDTSWELILPGAVEILEAAFFA